MAGEAGGVAGIGGEAGKNFLFSMFHSKFHSHSQYQWKLANILGK